MKELTPHQQKLWDLRQSGKTKHEIAEEMNISPNNVSKTITVIHKKLGIKPKAGERMLKESTNPELNGAVLDAMTEPLGTRVPELARELQIPEATLRGMIKRNYVRRGQFVTEVRRLKTRELLDVIDEKLWLISQYMDEYAVSQASLRDLGMVKAALIEKRQLLKGEPTIIVSDHERAKIHELAPALIAEIRRRGLTIEGEVVPEPEKTDEPA